MTSFSFHVILSIIMYSLKLCYEFSKFKHCNLNIKLCIQNCFIAMYKIFLHRFSTTRYKFLELISFYYFKNANFLSFLYHFSINAINHNLIFVYRVSFILQYYKIFLSHGINNCLIYIL